MIDKINEGVFLVNGELVADNNDPRVQNINKTEASKGTIASKIICAHAQEDSYEEKRFHIKFDAMASHTCISAPSGRSHSATNA